MDQVTDSVTDQVKRLGLAAGFHRVAIAVVPASGAPSEGDRAALERWLAAGYQASMAWMDNPRRRDVRQIVPEARSVIAVALNYYTPHQPSGDRDRAKISRYAWGRDYHKVLHGRLKRFVAALNGQFGGHTFRFYGDTGPVQDKAWAEQAGLGWIGKNGNLITRQYGSWVFLGEIITDLALMPDGPHTAHCGTCDRCIEACPTGAIAAPHVVDANRCIAYHTIENRDDTLPEAIRDRLGGWVAGCDICQDVCPWNQRFAQPTDVADFTPRPENLDPPLAELATLTDEEWDRRFTGSALRRIKAPMWRRNAQANLDAIAAIAPDPSPPPDSPGPSITP